MTRGAGCATPWPAMNAPSPIPVASPETGDGYHYTPRGVCSKALRFDIRDGRLHGVRFTGGCPGNLAAIGKLVEGRDATATADLLRGNDCGGRGTSCADQLARAIDHALSGASPSSPSPAPEA